MIPLTSRSKDVLPFLGTLSANFNLAEDHLSDFGTLTTLGYGANWSPIEGVRVIDRARLTVEEIAASECGFGYRTSAFKRDKDRWAVVAVRFVLAAGGTARIAYAELARALASGAERDLAAVRATVVSKPSRRSRRANGSAIESSSSTIRMRVGIARMYPSRGSGGPVLPRLDRRFEPA